MVNGKSLAATGTLAALILAVLLTATLAAPTLAATNQLTVSKMPTVEDMLRGRIGTNYLDMKFADLEGSTLRNFTYWTITPRNLGFTFNIHAAHIIEFNDANGNNILDDSDSVLRDIRLSDANWTLSGVRVTNEEAQVSFTGKYNEGGQLILELTVYIHVYFKDTNVTGPGYSAVVPGLRAVKVDIVIDKYAWVDGSGSSRLALVMVLKCQRVEAEYEYRYRLANGTTFGESDRTSGQVPPVSEDESEIGLVMARNEHEVRARFRWFNYALCSDTGQQVVNVISYFNVTEDGVELQLCVDHFGNSTVSFDPYFEVLSTSEGFPVEAVLLLSYYYVGQSGQVVGMVLVGAAVLLVAGVAVAVYFRRR